MSRHGKNSGIRLATCLVLVFLMKAISGSEAFIARGSRRCHARGSCYQNPNFIISSIDDRSRRFSCIYMENPLATLEGLTSERRVSTKQRQSPFIGIVQLILFSFASAIMLISWEEVSMYHPMRQNLPLHHQKQQQTTLYRWGDSTVRGLAFGKAQRIRLDDAEPQDSQIIPSYNEVMLEHRAERIPSWNKAMTEDLVKESVATIQRTVIYLQKCKQLANDYDWDGLTSAIRQPVLHQELEQACNNLKHADGYLSPEARDEIGFEWASCAWRHCGALADAQEAIDELDHLIGILEPFECLFCLDIVERSLYDILAVTQKYQDPSIAVPEYQPLQRKSDVGADGVDQFDTEYLEALEFLKKFEN